MDNWETRLLFFSLLSLPLTFSQEIFIQPPLNNILSTFDTSYLYIVNELQEIKDSRGAKLLEEDRFLNGPKFLAKTFTHKYWLT